MSVSNNTISLWHTKPPHERKVYSGRIETNYASLPDNQNYGWSYSTFWHSVGFFFFYLYEIVLHFSPVCMQTMDFTTAMPYIFQSKRNFTTVKLRFQENWKTSWKLIKVTQLHNPNATIVYAENVGEICEKVKSMCLAKNCMCN